LELNESVGLTQILKALGNLHFAFRFQPAIIDRSMDRWIQQVGAPQQSARAGAFQHAGATGHGPRLRGASRTATALRRFHLRKPLIASPKNGEGRAVDARPSLEVITYYWMR
jgi:hypothetical protein